MFQTEWTLVLGEQALDIYVPSASPSASSVFVLGERNLFCLRDNGQIRFMKKLEYNPSCFLPYTSGNGTVRSVRASFPPVNVNPGSPLPLRFGIRQTFSQQPQCSGKQIQIFKNILLSHGRLWLGFMASRGYICYSLSQLFLTVP